ncbi:MAG: serine--tRNA ligase [SAR202 cluster bacterium]|nr:serine--tRNA ligase [SAR202 cluster bacterium]|tara:strand:+ start:2520 stop:3773 length:1254 start_codon:yes stop_codon:yes gene_type:complete
MISIEKILSQKESVEKSLQDRGEKPPLDEIISLETRRKEIITLVDNLRNKKNVVSKDIGDSKRPPNQQEINDMRVLGEEIKSYESELSKINLDLEKILLTIPNIPLNDVPIGLDDSANEIIYTSETEQITHNNPHWDIGKNLNLLDIESSARISGSRFYVLRGKGAKLHRALGDWMLDVHTNENDYEEIDPPFLVKEETMIGSGNLPKFKENLYMDSETDLWLIPTAEVALNGMHQGQIIKPGKLPIKYVAKTPSFRKEHTAAGRDVRGIKRVHQFEKVEIFRFVEPKDSIVAHEEMLEEVVDLCKRLGLVYRVLKLSTGDIGFQSAKTYDIEVWSKGTGEWLEVSSVSNCLDFQTRRNNTRYKTSQNSSTVFPHTLNGSGLALPRIWIAVLENGLQKDGSIIIPEELVKYTGWEKI